MIKFATLKNGIAFVITFGVCLLFDFLIEGKTGIQALVSAFLFTVLILLLLAFSSLYLNKNKK